MLIFTAALKTLIVTLIIIYVLYGQSKLKPLVMNIAMQRIKAVEAADMSDILCTCKTQWYIMGMLIIVTLGMLYLVTNKIRKTSFCKGCLFSNNTKILLFISNTHWIWDVLEIDWSDVSITLNNNEIDLPSSVIIPFKERYRARKLPRKHPLLFYIMLKQGKTWFSLVPAPRNLSIANDNN